MRVALLGALGLVVLTYAACSSSSSTSSSNDGGPPGDQGDASGNPGNGTGSTIPPSRAADVLGAHKNPSKDGHYIDPTLTRAAARGMHRDPGFHAAIQGPVYAQPLYVEKGALGKETLYVVTEQDIVYALDAVTGAVIWQKTVGKPVAQRFFDCANIDPIGITGTPVIDINSRAIFFDAMTTTDDGTTKRHLVFALGLDDGSIRKGYPIELDAKAKVNGFGFFSSLQQQRGGLVIVNNGIYIPFGGYAGDCGDYRGYLVGFQMENPGEVHGWTTTETGGGIWGPGGPSSDGSTIYLSTGNGGNPDNWSFGDAVIRLGPGPTFSNTTPDWFTPSNRKELDAMDLELGSTQPILLDIPGATPSKVALAFGKNGNAYVLDRTNLGGNGAGDGTHGEGVASEHVSSTYIINAPAALVTDKGAMAIFKGAGMGCPTGSTLTAIHIATDTTPWTIKVAWCVDHHGEGSPVVSTTDGHSEAIAWTLGAEGDTKLHAWDVLTGEELFNGGADTVTPIARFQSPIVVKGRVIWASNEEVVAFTH